MFANFGIVMVSIFLGMGVLLLVAVLLEQYGRGNLVKMRRLAIAASMMTGATFLDALIFYFLIEMPEAKLQFFSFAATTGFVVSLATFLAWLRFRRLSARAQSAGSV
jgi:hypothetical protein